MLGISDIRAPHIGVSLDLNLISEDKRSFYTEEEKAIVVFILSGYVPFIGDTLCGSVQTLTTGGG